MSTYRHTLGIYTAVCSAAQYRMPDAGQQLTPARLYAALAALIMRHAPLGVSIVDEPTPAATFVRLPAIDLRRIVSFEHLPRGADRLAALDASIAAGLSRRFDALGELPLWRVSVLAPHSADADQAPDVVLFVHHGIADGTSAVLFHTELRVALNALGAPEPAEQPHVVPPALDFLPPIEALHKMPVSYLRLARFVLRPLFPRARTWTGAPAVQFTLGTCIRTRHMLHVVDADTLARLLAACRARGTTLQPLLEALFAHALFDALGAEAARAQELSVSCPINMRPFLPAHVAREMGDFVASDNHTFRRGEDVWAGAVRVHGVLAAALADIKTGSHVNTGMLRFVGDIRTYTEKKVAGPRDVCSFEVSNAGAVDGGKEGEWTIARAVFTQSTSATASPVQFSVCSVKGGCMLIGAGWQDGIVPEGLADRVFKRFDQCVRELLDAQAS
jgi:hypothetical protein